MDTGQLLYTTTKVCTYSLLRLWLMGPLMRLMPHNFQQNVFQTLSKTATCHLMKAMQTAMLSLD